MSWKEKVGTGVIINATVDYYLKEQGFYEDTMSPRFYNDESHIKDIKEIGARCLRLDTSPSDDKEATLRIFINNQEAYKEVQTAWRSFGTSDHINIQIDRPLTIEDIDKILDGLVD